MLAEVDAGQRRLDRRERPAGLAPGLRVERVDVRRTALEVDEDRALGLAVTGQAGAYQVEGAKNFQTLNIGGSGTTSVSFIVGV